MEKLMNDIYKTNVEDVDKYLNKEFYMLTGLESSYPPEAHRIKLLTSPISSIAYTLYNMYTNAHKGTILINEFTRLLIDKEKYKQQFPYNVDMIFISIDNYELYKTIHTKVFELYKNDAILDLSRELKELQTRTVQILPN
jgi:hypothetical protein